MAKPHPLLFRLVQSGAVDGASVTEAVVRSAQEHRLVALLEKGTDPPASHDLTLSLAGAAMLDETHRMRVMKVARDVHIALTEADIRHVFVKGVVEAHRLFPSADERAFRDVDLAIHPSESLGGALSVLIPGHPESDDIDALVSGGYRSSIGFFRDGIAVDLHTDALRNGPRCVSPDAWWNHATVVPLPGVGEVEAFDVAASTLLFLIHQARDRFRYLNGALEFKRRVETGIDWDAVETLARREGIWEQAAVAATVLAEAANLPVEFPMPSGWRTRLWERLWAPHVRYLGEDGRSRFNRRGQWLMPITSRGRFREIAGWIVRSIFPPDSHLRLRHPRARGPYLWRVVSTRISAISARRLPSLTRGRTE